MHWRMPAGSWTPKRRRWRAQRRRLPPPSGGCRPGRTRWAVFPGELRSDYSASSEYILQEQSRREIESGRELSKGRRCRGDRPGKTRWAAGIPGELRSAATVGGGSAKRAWCKVLPRGWCSRWRAGWQAGVLAGWLAGPLSGIRRPGRGGAGGAELGPGAARAASALRHTCRASAWLLYGTWGRGPATCATQALPPFFAPTLSLPRLPTPHAAPPPQAMELAIREQEAQDLEDLLFRVSG